MHLPAGPATLIELAEFGMPSAPAAKHRPSELLQVLPMHEFFGWAHKLLFGAL